MQISIPLAMANYTNRESFQIQFSLVQNYLTDYTWILIVLNVNFFFKSTS